MLAVRRFTAEDAPAVTTIIRGLPDYFTDDVPAKAERDAASHEAWVISDSGTVAGFAVAARKSPAGAEIPLPGWEPGNPAAIYVAALCPTR